MTLGERLGHPKGARRPDYDGECGHMWAIRGHSWTLDRLLMDSEMRRNGRDWYFWRAIQVRHLRGNGRTWTHLDAPGRMWTHVDACGRTWAFADVPGLFPLGTCKQKPRQIRRGYPEKKHDMDILELSQCKPTDPERLLRAMVEDEYEAILAAYRNRWAWAEIAEILIPADWLKELTVRQIPPSMTGYATAIKKHAEDVYNRKAAQAEAQTPDGLRQGKNKRLVREYVELCAVAGELSGQIPAPHIDYGDQHEPDHAD